MEKNKAEWVSLISFDIAKDFAPDELDLFEDFRDEFMKDPEMFTSGKTSKEKDKMLGFAMPGIDPFMIPAILSLAWVTIQYVIKTVGEAAVKSFFEKAGENAAGRLVKPGESKEPLTKDQIRELRDYAFTIAKNQKISEKKMSVIFDALIGKLSRM